MQQIIMGLLLLSLLAACSSTPTPQRLRSDPSATRDQPWTCLDDGAGEWRCLPLSQYQPLAGAAENTEINAPDSIAAKVEVSPPVDTAAPVAVAPVLAAVAEVAAATSDKAPSEHLSGYPAGSYAVQLLAVQKRQTIENYLDRHPTLREQNPIVTGYKDDWFVLLLGVYPDYASAKASLAALPVELTEQPWIRPL